MKKILFLILISFNSLFAITYSECTSDFSDNYYVFDINTRSDYYSYSLPSCDYEGWLSVTNPCGKDSYYIDPSNFQYDSDSGKCTWTQTSYSFSSSATPYCAEGTIYDYDSNSCVSDAPPPECTPDPQPENKINLGEMPTDDCISLLSLSSYEKDGQTYTNLQCWQDTCASNLDTAYLFGELISECTIPSSWIKVNVSESDCSGTINNYDAGVSGPLSWSSCNSSCYVSEPSPIPCSSYTPDIVKSLSPDCSNISFSCIDSTPSSIISLSCQDPDDGSTTDNNTSDPDDGSTTDNNTSDPDDGSTTDNNTSDLDLDKVLQALNDFSNNNHEDLSNLKSDLNDFSNNNHEDLSSLKSDLNNFSNKNHEDLSSLKSDLNNFSNKNHNDLLSIDSDLQFFSNQNNLNLNDIKELLTPDEQSVNDILSFDATSFLNSIKDSFDTLKSNFDNTKALFDNGFQYSVPSGSCVDPSATVFNRNIQLSICEPLATFKPAVYFISVVVFSILAIKIFMIGLFI